MCPAEDLTAGIDLTVALLGRNGVGKSTTIALADRLLGADVPAARSLRRYGELRISAVRDVTGAAGIATAGSDDLGARVTLLSASPTKGLERLYVVLTRAVSRLDVVHSRPLPF